jgi:cell division cycle 2-like protein
MNPSIKIMEMDLNEAMNRSGQTPFSQAENKSMMHQILSAVAHIHDHWIVHRDLKTK